MPGEGFPSEHRDVLIETERAEPMITVLTEQSSRSPRTRLLSPTRARILEGVACGETSHRLASRLHLSVRGVEYHIATMQRSLAASNRVTLVSRAYAAGLLRTDVWPPRVPEELIEY